MNDRAAFFFEERRRRFTLRRDFGISAATATLIAGAASAAAGGIAASRAGGAKPIPLPPVVPKPDLNSPSDQAAQERKAAQLAADTGRQSTILSPNAPTSLLASVGQPPPYSKSILGG